MLDQHIKELINAGLDGQLGRQEQRELEAVLDSSPEAVAFRDELLELNNAIRNLPELDSPPGLARNILDQIQLPARHKPFRLPDFLAGLNPAATGLAFAAGLLMAVGFYEFTAWKVTHQDTVDMAGTMVAGDQIKADRLLLGLDGLTGTISVKPSEKGQALEFELDSSRVIEIELDLEQAGLTVIGFTQNDRGDGNLIDTLELFGGTMRVVYQGRHHFVIYLRQSSDSKNHGMDIRIGISREGERVYEDTLSSWR